MSRRRVYLRVDGGGGCHLHTEHSFVIIHPLHARQLHLPQESQTLTSHSLPERTARTGGGLFTHIRGQDRVAGWRFFHGDGQTEGAGAQSALLHQRDPLRENRDTGWLARGQTTGGPEVQ